MRYIHRFAAFVSAVCLFTLFVQAADPVDGKYYRFVNVNYKDLSMAEDYKSGGVVCTTTGSNTTYTQLWKLIADGKGFRIQNAATGNYIQSQTKTSSQYVATTNENTLYFVNTSEGWTIRNTATNSQGLHCDAAHNVVLWYNDAAANKWTLQQVTVSEEAVAMQQLEYAQFRQQRDDADAEVADAKAHLSEIQSALSQLFVDAPLCTQLQASYAALSDEDLRAALAAMPASVINLAVKAKNDAWGHREQEFRLRDYTCYSDPDYWYKPLYIKRHSRINNPTGIGVNVTDVITVFVGADIPSGATLSIEAVKGNSMRGTSVTLNKGFNIFRPDVEGTIFLQYVGTTTVEGSTLITDYPSLPVHIEGGRVDGFWQKGEHDDDDWRDILSMGQSEYIQVKGDYAMYHMSREYISQCCPSTITDAIDWWDMMVREDFALMGIEDYYPSKYNCLVMCRSTLDGYQSAGDYSTNFVETYIRNLVPYNGVMANGDNCWGPGHEVGHTLQHAIQMVGTAENSNNLFAQLVMLNLGRYLSRGGTLTETFNDFAAGKNYIARDGYASQRMYWQLYLYFHHCGFNTDFYPRFFKALRAEPMAARDPDKNKHNVTGSEDQLLFARLACDAAQLDLTEFFEFYGFLTPCTNLYYNDYGDYYLTTTQAEVDAFRAYAKRYPKAPSLIFIEDRVKNVARTDGVSGNKQKFDIAAGAAGSVGHYTDFLDTSVRAADWVYARNGQRITLSGGTGALGFKVLSKEDDRLLYAANTLSFTLPDALKYTALHIVAASPDGTDVEVPSTAVAGTEAQQLTALKTSLANAKKILDLSDETGGHAGGIISSFLQPLQTLYDDALMAQTNADQSQHTYGEWSLLLDDALSAAIADPDVFVPLYPENIYAIIPASAEKYSVYYLSAGLKSSTSDPATNENKHWQFEATGTPGEYYIHCLANGYYVNSCESGAKVKAAAKEKNSALRFTIELAQPGYFTLVCTSNGIGIVSNSNRELVGSDALTTTDALWQLRTLTDNHAPVAHASADRALMWADIVLDDLLTSREPVIINDLALDATTDGTLSQLSGQYLAAYEQLSQMNATEETVNSAWLDLLTSRLSTLSDVVTASYQRRQSLPVEEGMWLLQNTITGLFCYVDRGTGRYAGNIRSGALADAAILTDYAFLIRPADNGQYQILMSAEDLPMAPSGSYIKTGVDDPSMWTLALADDSLSLFIGNDNGWWSTQTTGMYYAQFRNKQTDNGHWRLWHLPSSLITAIQPVSSDNAQPLAADVLYDLQGRQVKSATVPSGIYIQNGKKVWIK